jgi:hypothetical protein
MVKTRQPPPDGDVLTLLDEMIQRLHDAGLTDAEERARQAAELAGTDPAGAAEVLKEAAALAAAQTPERVRAARSSLVRLKAHG